jgi:hypothetical protein
MGIVSTSTGHRTELYIVTYARRRRSRASPRMEGPPTPTLPTSGGNEHRTGKGVCSVKPRRFTYEHNSSNALDLYIRVRFLYQSNGGVAVTGVWCGGAETTTTTDLNAGGQRNPGTHRASPVPGP